MKIQNNSNIYFGAHANVSYSTKSGEMKPAAEKFATYLRKIGSNDVTHEITVRNRFVDVKSLITIPGEGTVKLSGFTIKGKKAASAENLIRFAKAKSFMSLLKLF